MLWAIALAGSLVMITHLALGRRRPNVLEEHQAKTTLHVLDDNIVEYLTNPSPSTSPLLFTEIVSYNTHFEEIINGFKERKFRFVRIAHVLYDKGGPNFMKLRIDALMIYKVNGWTMNDLAELYHLLKITHRLWLDFKVIYEEVKTAVKGNWTQLKSTFQSTETPQVPRYNLTAMFQNILESTEFSTVTVISIPSTDDSTSFPSNNQTVV